jgi:hypothetical protein
MYCKDEICELRGVHQSCKGCSKKFQKDMKTWEEYLQEMGGIKKIKKGNEPIIELGDGSVLLGDLKDHKKDFEGVDSWKTARIIHQTLKDEFNLPETYEKLICES